MCEYPDDSICNTFSYLLRFGKAAQGVLHKYHQHRAQKEMHYHEQR